MNKAGRIAAAINSQANPFQLRACLFHCTPISERKRGTQWKPASFVRESSKNFNRRQRKFRKKTLLRDAHEFAENLFQSWESDRHKYEQPPGRKNSWFRPNFRDNKQSGGRSKNTSSKYRNTFDFCEDDDRRAGLDNIFRSMFGGNGSFYWSFIRDDEPRFRSSSTYSSHFRTSSGRTYYSDEEYEEYNTSQEYVRPVIDELRSDRLALGLSPSGPIKIEDVKKAYRVCALKWHPDRHQGSSKVVAEEKFKVCSAAYQSLCDKIAID